MQAVGSKRDRVSILIGAGVGLAIVALLVLQGVSSGGALGTTTEVTVGPPTAAASGGEGVSQNPGRLYAVTFHEGADCGSLHLTEWGVQLGNWTRTEPSNVTLSEIPENGGMSDIHFNLTTLTFSVPKGVYPFTLYPTTLRISSPGGWVLGGSAGVVTVTDSDVAIYTISAVGLCG